MARIQPVDVEETQSKIRVQLGGVAEKLSVAGSMPRTLARSPAAREGTLGKDNVWALILAGGDGTRLQLGGFRVQGFEENPAPSHAAAIIGKGALWSSFIMLFRVRRMLEIVRAVRPREMAAMERLLGDAAADRAGYGGIGAWNLSHDVLAQRPHDLLVIAADDLGWSDWGTPEAIARTISALGLTTPPWLSAPLTEARASA